MFKVSARTVLELGSELISSDIIAFYELIKNGFDAGTKNGILIEFNILMRRNSYVSILQNLASGKHSLETLIEMTRSSWIVGSPVHLGELAEKILSAPTSIENFSSTLQAIYRLSNISVSDTGSGMSSDDLVKNFLTIGTSSRKREVDKALKNGESKTPFLGEKGIGRLSAMRLGNHLRVETARIDDTYLNILDIDWSRFEDLEAMIDDIEIEPSQGSRKASKDWAGTKIIISSLSEDWTEHRVRELADYEFARLTDPFLDQKLRPRVAVLWNSERLAIPWMNQTLIENAHAKISGHYEIADGKPRLVCDVEAINLGFEHPREKQHTVIIDDDLESVVSGNSQDMPEGAVISVGPFSFEAHWYNRRLLTGIDGIGELSAVRDMQKKWSGILLFRDGFRVFPYGEDKDDWLMLDRKALSQSGYLLNKAQMVGRISISRVDNPLLVDQTNREGLRENPEQQVLLRIMQFLVSNHLREFLRSVEKQYKEQKVDLVEAKLQIISLESRAKNAVKRLRKILPKEDQEAVEDLQQAFFEFKEFAEKARIRIGEVEQESRQMIEMAGVGLMVEVVAHELARVSENALENLERLRRKAMPDEAKSVIDSLRSEMKSLSKRVRILDPMSVSGRQRSEVFSLSELIGDTIESHKSQFERHDISVDLVFPNSSLNVRAVKGMVIQILENLISNSKYWLQLRKRRDITGPRFQAQISITLLNNPPSIIYRDNGQGIAPENREKIFRPFFSLKEKSKRRGLGLFIARECAQYDGGTLVLSEKADRNSGRLHDFILEFPDSALIK